MTTVKAFIRTGKKDKEVNVRFRLSDGRSVQLFHKSEIMVSPILWDAKTEKYKAKSIIKLDARTSFNTSIEERKNLILSIYGGNKELTSEKLEILIDQHLHPEKYNIKNKEESMCSMFQRYVDGWLNTGVIGTGRKKHYDVVIRELTRFFIVNGINGLPINEFKKEHILNFRDFLRKEYTLVEKYPELYADMNKRNIPSKERSQNTIAEKLLLLQAFMIELESNDIIPVSPFRKIGKEKESIMKQQYDEPFFLTKTEFNEIICKECPEVLQRVKDVFIVQCCFGCRIGDFRRFTFDNIGVEEGIPFIHYLPQKTYRDGLIRTEIKTPIIKVAYDIIMKYKDTSANKALLPYYPEGNGETGYNYQIKKLLEFCGINRKVAIFNTQFGTNEYKPIYEIASSKLARKTHVDLMNKVQIDKYVAGLHAKGSGAVDRYTGLGIKERFILMCAAFGCNQYGVDDDLSIIE
ncbi:integrase [Bacteroides sp. AM10-21B]|uniref:integrase n=1 Tax=Bacteroides sp. AM10-21B TaxID=2292001 RepID=UPI000E4FF03C|nr:integrase [Bacteroides sp. AM10-21B]RHJ47485.1 integrase [Bacteroides sp. AM10-21B]